jgi:hypothetical protein
MSAGTLPWKPSVATSIAVTTTRIAFLGVNPDRTAITITGTDNPFYVSPSPSIVAKQGILIYPNSLPVTLCRCHLGDWVTRQLFAIATVGTANAYVIEGFEEWRNHQRNP